MPAVHETLLQHNALSHRALLRLLERLQEHAVRGDLPPEVLRRGVAASVTALRGHHASEDEVLLPFLRTRPGTTEALAAIHSDHERVAAGIARLAHAPDADLGAAVGAVLRTFADHCGLEEALLTALPWGTWGEEEVRALGKGVSDHARRYLRPTHVQLPLLLYNLDPEERRAFTSRMPRFVSALLVPWAFRPGWRGMRPFLAHAPPRFGSRRARRADG